jgi:phage terminase large subunit GpA-like protein
MKKKKTHKTFLNNIFAEGLRPEQNTDIVDWCKKNVRLATSSRSEQMDLTLTPWLVEPLKQILGNENSDITIVAPVGSGKSTMLTAAVTYLVAERPGPTLVACQTNPEAQSFFETTLLPSLKSCPGISKLWPTKKNYIRKDMILFPHMPLYVSGANLTTFTGKSVDTVIIDEAWLVKKSLLLEGKRRTHNRFNSHYVLLGQAGIVGDDFDVAFNESYKHEFCYQCPKCGEFHQYNFDDFKFECDKSEDGNYIWSTLLVNLECPSCHHVIPDTINSRRSLTESSKYLPAESKNPINQRISFHYNAFCIWWISWHSLILEFLQANNLKKAGDFDPIRQFFQKRIARSFDEDELLLENGEIGLSDYTLKDAETIRGDATIITADVQMDVIFYVIRTWWKDGTSKLLSYGTTTTFEQLRDIQLMGYQG